MFFWCMSGAHPGTRGVQPLRAAAQLVPHLTAFSLQAAKNKALAFGTDKENDAGAGKAEGSALATTEHDDTVNLDVEVSVICMAPVTCSNTPLTCS